MPPGSTRTPPTLRDVVFDVARRRFVAQGLDGLAVRAIADEAGCTTMAVYTHFGGKDGLVQAFFDEGFERLAAAQRAVSADLAPRERALALCHAYRRLAHELPHHYDLMLGARSGGFRPAPESRRRALGTIEYLADVLLPLQAPGPSRKMRANDHAQLLVAFCHGWVTLERAGLLAADARQERAFDRGARELLTDSSAR